MKKVIRIAAMALIVIGLNSCTKDTVNNSLPVVTPSSVTGTYKISIAVVDKPIDTNKDGYSTTDLLADGYNSCEFDNQIQITNNTYSDIKQGKTCNSTETNDVYDYVLDTTAKTMILKVNGVIVETITEVHQDDTSSLKYARFDKVLNQTIYFKLTKI